MNITVLIINDQKKLNINKKIKSIIHDTFDKYIIGSTDDFVELLDKKPLDGIYALVYANRYPLFLNKKLCEKIINTKAQSKPRISLYKSNTTTLFVGSTAPIREYLLGTKHKYTTQYAGLLPMVGINLKKKNYSQEFNFIKDLRDNTLTKSRKNALNYIGRIKDENNIYNVKPNDTLELIKILSGQSNSIIKDVLQSVKYAICIQMLEELESCNKNKTELDLESIIIKIPYLGYSFIEDKKVMVTDLGIRGIDMIIDNCIANADAALAQSISKLKTSIIRGDI